MYQYPLRPDELMHYGVKGMRWSKGHKYIKRIGDKLYYESGLKARDDYLTFKDYSDNAKRRYDYYNQRQEILTNRDYRHRPKSHIARRQRVTGNVYRRFQKTTDELEEVYEAYPLGKIHKAGRKIKGFIDRLTNTILGRAGGF